jgi:hypothetical protein
VRTASAFTLAVVAASFGAAFAASSLIAGHVLIRIGLRAMLVGALARNSRVRWALLTAALAELIAFPLVQVMPAVTESLKPGRPRPPRDPGGVRRGGLADRRAALGPSGRLARHQRNASVARGCC